MSEIVGLPNNSYKPITNTAWVCKLHKRVHSKEMGGIQSNCLTSQQVYVRILTLSVPDEVYSRHASCILS
jgi:hypothetical protein